MNIFCASNKRLKTKVVKKAVFTTKKLLQGITLTHFEEEKQICNQKLKTNQYFEEGENSPKQEITIGQGRKNKREGIKHEETDK